MKEERKSVAKKQENLLTAGQFVNDARTDEGGAAMMKEENRRRRATSGVTGGLREQYKIKLGLENRRFFSSRIPHRTDLCGDSGAQLRAFGMWKVEKMVRSIGKTSKSRSKKYANLPPEGFERSKDNTREESEDSWSAFSKPSMDNLSSNSSQASPTRDAVLKACTLTSGFLVALVGLEMQDVPLTIGTVALISSCRYILLKTWPEFSESSEAANQQELLFRGALLPLLGLNWKSAIVVGAIFGGLHLGGGRRYPFAIW
ncbi:hypothetical protein MA16_Dca001620 [Dendrobium catenatum]|uniref:Uncharacterized protein n=1 Tax=Dendrobium catenatum TaxID=906689 RepID=A0A2I0WMX6_9ASPA|nr:hypothetical protein MA16_Dca001620 [Dendrobium catenatum]